MTENRRQVLEMLSSGQINTDEADRLIGALGEPAASVAVDSPESRSNGQLKYLRVLVDMQEADGPLKVNVRIPLQLLRAGVKLASLIPAQAQTHVNEALCENGVAFDVSQIKPENLEELIDHLRDFTVDVDQSKDNLRVKVFCE